MKNTVAVIVAVVAFAAGIGYWLYSPHLMERSVMHTAESVSTASLNHQYDFMWDYMHPDDQSYWGGKATYTDLMKRWDDVRDQFVPRKSARVLPNTRKLPTWQSPYTRKTYSDVYEVPIETISVKNGSEEAHRTLMYLQSVNGSPRYFTGTDRAELEANLKRADALLGGSS